MQTQTASPNKAAPAAEPAMVPSTWKIEIDASGVSIERLHQGRVVESYVTVPPAKAAIWLCAISQGYQPPRGLLDIEDPLVAKVPA